MCYTDRPVVLKCYTDRSAVLKFYTDRTAVLTCFTDRPFIVLCCLSVMLLTTQDRTRDIKYIVYITVDSQTQSTQRLATGDRISMQMIFSAPIQDGPGAQPASYKMCNGFLPGGKAAGVWC